MSLLRTTVGGALTGTAQVLSLASKLLEATAKSLKTEVPGPHGGPRRVERMAPPSAPIGTEATVRDVVEDPADLGQVVEPPSTPLLDGTPHVRTSETHIEELAEQPATAVVNAVSDLSTDELRLLTEYELAHKNRRTVLAAIEKALTPA